MHNHTPHSGLQEQAAATAAQARETMTVDDLREHLIWFYVNQRNHSATEARKHFTAAPIEHLIDEWFGQDQPVRVEGDVIHVMTAPQSTK